MNDNIFFLEIAKACAMQSTCIRRKYGAVIVDPTTRRILSTGYTGQPTNMQHCSDIGKCLRNELNIPQGSNYELCLHGDTIIKLLDGTYKSIREMVNENKPFYWGYGCDFNGNVIPTKLYSPIKTTSVSSMVKIELYKGGYFECTPIHKILMRNGKYKEARDIKKNDSIMPLYYHFGKAIPIHEYIGNSSCAKESIGNTHSSPTHNMVFDYFNPNIRLKLKQSERCNVHHIDGDSLNNVPENLELLTSSEHTFIHNVQNKYSKHSKKLKYVNRISLITKEKQKYECEIKLPCNVMRSINCSENWKRLDFRILQRMGTIKSNRDPTYKIVRTVSKFLASASHINDLSDTELTADNYDYLRLKYKYQCYQNMGYYPPLVSTILNYYNSIDEFITKSKTYNHKVKSVSTINYDDEIDVYDISSDTSNFAIITQKNTGIFVHNCKSVHAEMNAIINRQSNVNDTILYLYGWDNELNVEIIPKPCFMCTKMLINARISKIITRHAILDPVELYWDYEQNMRSGVVRPTFDP